MQMRLVEESTNEVCELDFNVDGFHQQKIFKGIHSFARNFDRLLRMRKRSNPSDPDMGIDLLSYRFKDIDKIVGGELKQAIKDQASKYIPNSPIESIDISSLYVKGDYVLYITVGLFVTQEKVTFGYYEKEGNVISTKITVTKPKLINTKGSS